MNVCRKGNNETVPSHRKKGDFGTESVVHSLPKVPFPFDVDRSMFVPAYVPMVHDDRYFFCSAVKLSMLIPMALSFPLAIAISISAGTG